MEVNVLCLKSFNSGKYLTKNCFKISHKIHQQKFAQFAVNEDIRVIEIFQTKTQHRHQPPNNQTVSIESKNNWNSLGWSLLHLRELHVRRILKLWVKLWSVHFCFRNVLKYLANFASYFIKRWKQKSKIHNFYSKVFSFEGISAASKFFAWLDELLLWKGSKTTKDGSFL